MQVRLERGQNGAAPPVGGGGFGGLGLGGGGGRLSDSPDPPPVPGYGLPAQHAFETLLSRFK
eukprot:scaffold37877_cov60-Phaeocystis_antarctica.AAC.1